MQATTYQRKYHLRGDTEVMGCERIELRRRTRNGWETVKVFTGRRACILADWVDEAHMEGLDGAYIDEYLDEVAHGAHP